MKTLQHKKETEQFRIKNPTWTFWVCLLITIGFLTAFFVYLYLNTQNTTQDNSFYLVYIFLVFSLAGGVGVYISLYEKFTYSNRYYKYYPPFGKKQSAKVEDIYSVKISTRYYRTKCGIVNKTKVFFYDIHKNVLIKVLDDGTLSKNELFLKSLKVNHIGIIHEENYK